MIIDGGKGEVIRMLPGPKLAARVVCPSSGLARVWFCECTQEQVDQLEAGEPWGVVCPVLAKKFPQVFVEGPGQAGMAFLLEQFGPGQLCGFLQSTVRIASGEQEGE